MGANIAGIYGAQIFRSDDSPRYRRGFNVNIGVLVAGLSLAVVRFLDDRFRRKKIKDQVEIAKSGEEDEHNHGNSVVETTKGDVQQQSLASEEKKAF